MDRTPVVSKMRRHRPWSDLDRRHDTQTSPQGWQAQHPQALVATPWVKQTASKTLNACNTTNTVQMAICNTTNTVQMAISSAGSSRARWPVWCLPQAVCTWTRLLHHRIGQAGTVPSRSHWRPRLPPMGRHQRLANLCRLFARPKRLGRISTGRPRRVATRGRYMPPPLSSVPLCGAVLQRGASAPPPALSRAQSPALWMGIRCWENSREAPRRIRQRLKPLWPCLPRLRRRTTPAAGTPGGDLGELYIITGNTWRTDSPDARPSLRASITTATGITSTSALTWTSPTWEASRAIVRLVLQ
jgi:hypothetical protein